MMRAPVEVTVILVDEAILFLYTTPNETDYFLRIDPNDPKIQEIAL